MCLFDINRLPTALLFTKRDLAELNYYNQQANADIVVITNIKTSKIKQNNTYDIGQNRENLVGFRECKYTVHITCYILGFHVSNLIYFIGCRSTL